MKKIAVVGSRKFPKMNLVEEYINSLATDTIIISGGAKGVDFVAAKTARKRGMTVIEILPEWEKYGKAAGFIRNKEIVKMADEVSVFWDGISRGSKHDIDLAKEYNKPLNLTVAEQTCDSSDSYPVF